MPGTFAPTERHTIEFGPWSANTLIFEQNADTKLCRFSINGSPSGVMPFTVGRTYRHNHYSLTVIPTPEGGWAFDLAKSLDYFIRKTEYLRPAERIEVLPPAPKKSANLGRIRVKVGLRDFILVIMGFILILAIVSLRENKNEHWWNLGPTEHLITK